MIITGCGHSGTHFMAQKMGFEHEPRKGDFVAYRNAMEDKNFSQVYVENNFDGSEREVNSLLFPHREALWDMGHNIIHLVRDPRKVVRSLISGEIFDADVDYLNPPIDGDTRFERVCKFWNYIAEEMKEYPTIRIENFQGEPTNSKKKNFPKFENWEDKHKETFFNICGDNFKYYYEDRFSWNGQL